MTIKELTEKLKEYPSEAIVCQGNLWDTVMEREIEDILDYFDSAVYIDKKGNTQRGKIVVI